MGESIARSPARSVALDPSTVRLQVAPSNACGEVPHGVASLAIATGIVCEQLRVTEKLESRPDPGEIAVARVFLGARAGVQIGPRLKAQLPIAPERIRDTADGKHWSDAFKAMRLAGHLAPRG